MSADITPRERLTSAASLMARAGYQIPTSDPATFDAERKETLRGTLALARRSCELIEGVLAEVAPELVLPGTRCLCWDGAHGTHDHGGCARDAVRFVTVRSKPWPVRDENFGEVTETKTPMCTPCADHAWQSAQVAR